MNISGLKPDNKGFSGKAEDLVEISFRRSTFLLNNESKVISISLSQW